MTIKQMTKACARASDGGTPAPKPTIIVASPAELTTIVYDAVALVLAEHRAEPPALFTDRDGIARVFDVGVSTIDRMRKQGLPEGKCGDDPRFHIPTCIAWWHARQAGNDDPRERARPDYLRMSEPIAERANSSANGKGAGRTNGSA